MQLEVYLYVSRVGNAATRSPQWILAWTFTLQRSPVFSLAFFEVATTAV